MDMVTLSQTVTPVGTVTKVVICDVLQAVLKHGDTQLGPKNS